jgi:hypothetical protein
LINQPVNAPLQFSKNGKMILQSHQPLFDSKEAAVTSPKRGAAQCGGLRVIDLLDEKYRRPPRLRNLGSNSFGFSFSIRDGRADDSPDEIEPVFIGFPVALRRAKSGNDGSTFALSSNAPRSFPRVRSVASDNADVAKACLLLSFGDRPSARLGDSHPEQRTLPFQGGKSIDRQPGQLIDCETISQ